MKNPDFTLCLTKQLSLRHGMPSTSKYVQTEMTMSVSLKFRRRTCSISDNSCMLVNVPLRALSQTLWKFYSIVCSHFEALADINGLENQHRLCSAWGDGSLNLRLDNEVAPERGDLISLSAALVSSAVSLMSLWGERSGKGGGRRCCRGGGLSSTQNIKIKLCCPELRSLKSTL